MFHSSESVYIMQRLELSGWLGLFIIIGSSLAVLFLVLILPSMVATALWNALVYETLGGPVIGIQQGFLLWAIVCVVLYGIFRPSIHVVLDEADLANMDDVDFNFGTKKSSVEKLGKKETGMVTKPKTPKKQAENNKPSASSENERFSLRSAAPKERTPTPSAHWLKWRKQQAEALQLAAETKLQEKKQQALDAKEQEEQTPKK